MAVNVFPLDPSAGSPSYAAQAVRQALSALVGPFPSGRPLGAISGVRPGTPSTTVAVSGLTVTVHPHSGIVDAETSSTAGPYFYFIDADVTKTLGAASGSNPRVDLISVQVSDPTQDASSTPGGDIVITPGTPSATPATPATPAGSMAIAVANVPKSGTGSPSITWTAKYATAAGGITPVSGPANYPAAPYVGQQIDDATLGPLRWDGTAWQRYGTGGLTDWTAPTAVGVGITASTSVPPGVIREGRIVIVRGIITAAFVNNGSPTGAVITLPAGFRPGTPVIRNGLAATNSVNAFVRGTVNADGTVIIQNGSAGPAATGIDLSALSGYIAEN